MGSLHHFACQVHECLSPEFASFVADVICYAFCFVFLFPLCVTHFPSVSPLRLLPPTLPWCSCLTWHQGSWNEECKQCDVDYFFSHLMLASAKCGWKRRRKGCWSISAQVGAGSLELAQSRSSSCVCIHAGSYLSCAAAPLGTETTYRNYSSLNKTFFLQDHVREADQNLGHA